VVAVLVGAVSLTTVAYLRHEHKDYIGTATDSTSVNSDFKVNLLKAFVPLFPLSLLLVSSSKIIPGMQVLGISHAMILGVFLAFVVTRYDPSEVSKSFFSGMGEGFGHIYGILISAIVFVGGMNAVGLIKAVTDAMIANPHIAKITAAYGPFIIAVISGSGDGPAVAFNKAVSVNAADFGMSPMNMGSMVALATGLGRSMSPIAGAAVICASFAGCSPLEVAKRNAPGMIIAVTVAMILLLYL
jgi:C4-dicarboxylate transporter, DcuC family